MSITSAKASPGKDVTVQLSINDAAGIAGLDVSIEYDPSLITVRDVKGSDLVSGMSIDVNIDLEGKIIVAMAGLAPIISGSGSLMDIVAIRKGV